MVNFLLVGFDSVVFREDNPACLQSALTKKCSRKWKLASAIAPNRILNFKKFSGCNNPGLLSTGGRVPRPLGKERGGIARKGNGRKEDVTDGRDRLCPSLTKFRILHWGLNSSGACPGGAPAHGRFYTYVLNNIDVVISHHYLQPEICTV